ncbi:hypothetical protein WMY93_010508 [Mugilogobius chulae]|uniref:Uncharacterized protein n=1 Tax=Mugilogobius chulae TaxID=88201 RepID=A0AAW0PHZ5_9GOBI
MFIFSESVLSSQISSDCHFLIESHLLICYLTPFRASHFQVLGGEGSSDRIVRTEEGLTRWSQNAPLSQALFGLAEQDTLQMRAASVSLWMVWLLVGDTEVVAQGPTREEASVKAMSLALEVLRKQQKLEERDEGKEVEKEREEPIESSAEEKAFQEQELGTEQTLEEEGQEQRLDMSDVEEKSAPEPSAVHETKEKGWLSKDKNVCEGEETDEQTEGIIEEETQPEKGQEQSLNVSDEEASVPEPSDVCETKESNEQSEEVVEEDHEMLESEETTGLKQEEKVKTEEIQPEERQEQSLSTSDEEKSVPEPSALESENEDTGDTKKERDEKRVIETEEEREIAEEEVGSSDSEARTEERLPEEVQESLDVSHEDESRPGPSAVFESQKEESKASAETEEQTLGEVEEEKETQKPLETGYDAFRDTFQELMQEFDEWRSYQEQEIENLGQTEVQYIVETDYTQDYTQETANEEERGNSDSEYATGSDASCSFYTDSEKEPKPQTSLKESDEETTYSLSTQKLWDKKMSEVVVDEQTFDSESEGKSDILEEQKIVETDVSSEIIDSNDRQTTLSTTSSGTVIETSETNDSSEPAELLHSLEKETEEETEDKSFVEKFIKEVIFVNSLKEVLLSQKSPFEKGVTPFQMSSTDTTTSSDSPVLKERESFPGHSRHFYKKVAKRRQAAGSEEGSSASFASEDDSDSTVATKKKCKFRKVHFEERLRSVSEEIESSEVETEEKTGHVEDEILGEEQREMREEQKVIEVEREVLEGTAEEEENGSTSDDTPIANVNEDSPSAWFAFLQTINKWTGQKEEERRQEEEGRQEEEEIQEEEGRQEEQEEERQEEEAESVVKKSADVSEEQEVCEEESGQEEKERQEEEERQELEERLEEEERQEEEEGKEEQEEERQEKWRTVQVTILSTILRTESRNSPDLRCVVVQQLQSQM